MGKIIFWLFVILLVVVVANAVFTESVKVGGWPWSSAEPEKKEEVKKAETCSPITEREMMAIKNISNPCPLNDTNKKVIDASLAEIRKSDNFTDSFKNKLADMANARVVKESPERLSKENIMIIIDDKTKKDEIVNKSLSLNKDSYVTLAVKFDKKGGLLKGPSDQKEHKVKIAVLDMNDLAKYGNDKLAEKYKQSCDASKSRQVTMTMKEEGSCKNDLSLESVQPKYIVVVYCEMANGELYPIGESQPQNNITNCIANISVKNDFAHVFSVVVLDNNSEIINTKFQNLR